MAGPSTGSGTIPAMPLGTGREKLSVALEFDAHHPFPPRSHAPDPLSRLFFSRDCEGVGLFIGTPGISHGVPRNQAPETNRGFGGRNSTPLCKTCRKPGSGVTVSCKSIAVDGGSAMRLRLGHTGLPLDPTRLEGVSDEAGEELTEYVYTELEAPHSIRLLSLRPGDKKGGEVFCELLDRNLDDTGLKYEALSWSWGTDLWDEKIKILHNGEDYFSKVPRSLVAALKALRYSNRVRMLWIDAICIDQHQPNKKNKQVPVMSRIYGGC